MKKLSLDQLKEKVTVINENEQTQAISGGETSYNPIYWAGYLVHELWEWVNEE